MSYFPQEPNKNQPPLPPPNLHLVPQDEVRPDPHHEPTTEVEVIDAQAVTLIDGQVDNDELERLTSGSATEVKVIADWVKDADAVKEAVAGWFVSTFQLVAFHVLRTHIYVGRLVKLSPLGVWRLLAMWGNWVREAEYQDDHKAVKSSGGDVIKHKKLHRKAVLNRALTSLGVALVASTVALIVASMVHTFYVVLAVLVVVCGLGAFGAPKSKQSVIERAVYREPQAPKFTESLMLDALRQCGAEPKGARKIQVIQPPVKIKSGWEAIVSVGIEAEAIIERHRRFATVLDRPQSCVWLTTDTEQAAGWLRIVVTRKSLRRTKAPAWPFLEHSNNFNWFVDEVPIGIDETGQPVGARKAFTSSVCGGQMGAGKTESMITSVAGQACDPRVEIDIFDLKGGTDWEAFADIAHVYISGSEPSHFKEAAKAVTDLNRRMDARFETLKNLPEDLKSKKTTDQLASMRHLDLHPIVIMIDETQEFFEFASEAKFFKAGFSRLLKKGRAVGIVIEAASQEINKKTMPIASMCHWRLCHSVQGHGPVDLILGTGAYKAGFDAAALTTEDVGIAYFGSGKDISVIKSYYIDQDNTDNLPNVMARLRAERQQQGLLTGQAAGEEPQDDIQESTLDLVARVWPDGANKLQWVELVDVLHAAMPGDYPTVGDLSMGTPDDVERAVDSLSSQLLRDGIKARSVRSRVNPKKGETSTVRRGVHLEDIAKALDDRGTRMSNVVELDTGQDTEVGMSIAGDVDIDDEFDTDLDIDDIAGLDGDA